MPDQPYDPANENDDEAPVFPEVGELLTMSCEIHGDHVIEVIKDHGPARLYTVSNSDGEELMAAIDGKGVILTFALDPE